MQMALEELEEHADVGYGNKDLLQALRDRLAQWKALDRMVAENERLGLYDDLDEAIKKGTKAWAGVDPTEYVENLRGDFDEWPCKTHPDAPHGYDRNASLSLDRYVCECESWEPPPEPKPVAWADKHDIERDGHDFYVSRQQPAKDGVPLYTAPPKREWIGLTEEEVDQCYADTADEFQFYQAIEAKLKERNT